MFKTEILANGISGILRPNQRVIMSHFVKKKLVVTLKVAQRPCMISAELGSEEEASWLPLLASGTSPLKQTGLMLKKSPLGQNMSSNGTMFGGC